MKISHAIANQVWNRALTSLLPDIHPVDQPATEIWFAFYPLDLARALQDAEDPDQVAQDLLLKGTYALKDQIDSSHWFFYGHRYWPEVKRAVEEHASTGDLEQDIRTVAGSVGRRLHASGPLLLGITAVAFMTIEQVGIDAFRAAPGSVARAVAKTPEQVLAQRARDDRQNRLLGLLKGNLRKTWTVTFNENDPEARFPLIDSQQITTAAAEDKRDHHRRNPRCMAGEGPIPIECRAAACGTCWIGVLGGAEKLSEVQSLESRRIKEFGYIDTNEPRPLIRLACMAQAFGAVSIVIPPWNGVFGKHLRDRKHALSA